MSDPKSEVNSILARYGYRGLRPALTGLGAPEEANADDLAGAEFADGDLSLSFATEQAGQLVVSREATVELVGLLQRFLAGPGMRVKMALTSAGAETLSARIGAQPGVAPANFGDLLAAKARNES